MTMPSLFDQPAAQRHSATSRAAASAIVPTRLTLQEQVYRCILRAETGVTDEQICEHTLLNPSTERPRRIELVKKGLVRDSGRTRKTASGRSATVWIAA